VRPETTHLEKKKKEDIRIIQSSLF